MEYVKGHFKAKFLEGCGSCKEEFKLHKEKESVSLADRMVEVGFKDQFDVVPIATGDSDFAPALRCLRLGIKKPLSPIWPEWDSHERLSGKKC